MFYSLKNKKWSDFKEFEDSLCIFSIHDISNFRRNSGFIECENFTFEFSKFLYEIRKSLNKDYPNLPNWPIRHFEIKFEDDNDNSKMLEYCLLEDNIDTKNYHPFLLNLVDSYLCQNQNWQFLRILNYEPFNNLIDLYNSIKNKFHVISK